MAHYDEPPPEAIEDLRGAARADRFRFANVLRGVGRGRRLGRIRDYGYDGGGLMGSTTVKVGPVARTFEAVGLPDIAPKPVHGDGLGDVHADRRRAHRRARPAPGAAPAVRAVAGAARVDDAVADDARRRQRQGRDDGREPLPAPLGL